jgi:hypothetical protein
MHLRNNTIYLGNPLFAPYTQKEKQNQELYSLLRGQPYARVSVETIAERFGVSYLQAHRLARRFVKAGWARRSDIDWPIVNKRGRASRISRVAISYVSPIENSNKQW